MTNDAIDREEQILQEIRQRLDAMYEETEQSCIPCCVKIKEEYVDAIEPLMQELEELERGDRIISSPNKSHKGDA